MSTGDILYSPRLHGGKKIVNSVAGRTVESASFGWNPIEAYLAGRKKRQAKKEARKQKK